MQRWTQLKQTKIAVAETENYISPLTQGGRSTTRLILCTEPVHKQWVCLFCWELLVQLFVILLKSGLSSWKSIMTCLTILGEQLLFRGAISPPLGPGGIHFKSLDGVLLARKCSPLVLILNPAAALRMRAQQLQANSGKRSCARQHISYQGWVSYSIFMF